jgi:TM2 domain-containing membrane protein YozV
MSDPSAGTKTCPECGSENMADAITCNNAECTHIFAGDEAVTTPAAETATAEWSAPPAEELVAAASEPEPAYEPPMAPTTPVAESAAPVMAAPAPEPPPVAPEVAAPVIQPPPAPMPPAGSAPATYAPPSMTTPPPYTPPPPTEARLGGSGKSKTTAGILAILLGTLGVHQFYLGKTGWGIGFLVVSIATCGFGTMLTGPVSIIQGIMYLVGSDEEFERKYVLEGKFF